MRLYPQTFYTFHFLLGYFIDCGNNYPLICSSVLSEFPLCWTISTEGPENVRLSLSLGGQSPPSAPSSSLAGPDKNTPQLAYLCRVGTARPGHMFPSDPGHSSISSRPLLSPDSHPQKILFSSSSPSLATCKLQTSRHNLFMAHLLFDLPLTGLL